MVVLFLIFWEISVLFSMVAAPPPHQLCTRIPFYLHPRQHLLFLDFLTTASLTGVRCCLPVALSSVSLTWSMSGLSTLSSTGALLSRGCAGRPSGWFSFPDSSAAFDVVDQPFCSETLFFLAPLFPSCNADTAPQSPFEILLVFLDFEYWNTLRPVLKPFFSICSLSWWAHPISLL